jgi:hypothetical protein
VRRSLSYADAVEAYLRGNSVPRYMGRLRELENEFQALCRALEHAYRELVEARGQDVERFATEWTAKVEAWSFERVNTLVRQHNAWYPLEVDLPMDPRTCDYVLVRGASYMRRELGREWALEHFPADPRVRAPKLPARVPRAPARVSGRRGSGS